MKSVLLPIFPLQLVCYPGENINLHIFEPRYKQLIEEADASGLEFGIPTYFQHQNLDWGTSVKLKEIVKKYPDGKMDITVEGQSVFSIEQFIPRMNNRLYSGADVLFPENDVDQDFSKNRELLALMTTFVGFLKLHKPLPSDEFAFRSYDVAHFIGFSLEKEYKLLSILTETGRLQFMIEHLNEIIPVLHEINALEQKVKMNGHFKNIIPPGI